MNLKMQSLLKPSWRVSDIVNYLNCSRSTAQRIKNAVAEKYGTCELDLTKKHTHVKGDDVIKYLGGINRFTEMQILCKTLEEERKNERL